MLQVDIQQKQSYIQLLLKDSIEGEEEKEIAKKAKSFLSLTTGKVKSVKEFFILDAPDRETLSSFAHNTLKDPVIHDVYLDKPYASPQFYSFILVTKRPGVTDDEGMSAQKALFDFLNLPFEPSQQQVFSQDVYWFEKKLSREELHKVAHNLLGNPLIHLFEYGEGSYTPPPIPRKENQKVTSARGVAINLSDKELLSLSKERHLALSLEEMQAIKAFYGDCSVASSRKKLQLPSCPTDCELEILAQTWSEHCKHKEFNALIEYSDLETKEQRTINSLFKSKIKASTEIIQQQLQSHGHHWLVKVFSDNAGVVRINKKNLFVWKVETHNTPSALDPYGGAITGILGNNRDAFGTGVGGGALLFNTNVLCFASPNYDKPLLKGQLHPSRVIKGVVEGIMDGGNKSGVPTVNGSVVFDDRYCGKPLVFCGTGATMPSEVMEEPSWHKPISSGDRILMAGGRVGKDGIHGATLSSTHVDSDTPQTVVQIGSPFTQKLLSDFLLEACNGGFVKTTTDNGAGGLSSSVGELALISGGAEVHLEKVPLKYDGLLPWEIFLSESQERMTLVVEEEKVSSLMDLAKAYGVEVTDIGQFTSSGHLDIFYGRERVAHLPLDFLHEGLPQKKMVAEWLPPDHAEPFLPDLLNYNTTLLKLLSSLNICSRESIIRRYDHEVKGGSIIKPLMGPQCCAPQDAAVVRLNFNSFEGLIISNGIIPRYGDIDPYHMSAGAFDEAVRQIISVGGSLPNLSLPSSSFWSVNDNFCLPDSAYDPETNRDGKYKLAQLVRMCDALYDLSTAYLVPMTSGKDSMKNDFRDGTQKISIPPTILYSMVSQIDDVRKVTTSDFKQPGDLIFLLGTTYNELGGSEFYHLLGEIGANVPIVRPHEALPLYRKVSEAHQLKLLESCHDLSDGGLAVALAESAFGGNLGIEVELPSDDLTLGQHLFSESHSRFIVSIAPDKRDQFEKLFSGFSTFLGEVKEEKVMTVLRGNQKVINLDIDSLLNAWRGGFQI